MHTKLLMICIYHVQVQRKRYEEHYGDEYEVNNLPDDVRLILAAYKHYHVLHIIFRIT